MFSVQTLAQLSINFLYSAIAVYALAMLAYAAHAARRATSARFLEPVELVPTGAGGGQEAGGVQSPPAGTSDDANPAGAIGTSLTVLGFLLHTAAVITRGWAAGRAPWGNMYEFALVGALAAVGTYLVFLRKEPVRDLGVWVIAIVLLSLGLGVTVLYTPPGALVPVLNSYWLVIHVAAAIASGGIFTVGTVATLLYLLKLRSERTSGDKPSPYAGHLPGSTMLERISHTAHLFAFPIWTFAVIAGAIWAENSWGRYWGWDPKETWAFITWILYAAYLHAQATAGWRGARAAWFALAGYLAFLFNFFGVNIWIPGLHSYAGI
jgi:cytochrome c-type biogenesis protein CcsB